MSSLQATMLQYPPEILSLLLGHCPITDTEGQDIMEQLDLNNASTGSNGSVKDGIGGHSFCISTNIFTKNMWEHAQTVDHRKDISSLRTEHGGVMGVLLLLYAMQIFYPHIPLPLELKIYVDNSEVVRRGARDLPSLGLKQQLVLDYNLLATTVRLLEVIPCAI